MLQKVRDTGVRNRSAILMSVATGALGFRFHEGVLGNAYIPGRKGGEGVLEAPEARRE